MQPEMKSLILDLKAIDGDYEHGEFEAILSTPDVDREGESVKPGAFNPLPKSIPIHFSHDFISGAAPIGAGEPFYDGDTLKVRGRFAPTPRAQEMRSLVNGGFITAMSAGFIRTDKGRSKDITSGDLIEGSLTATPINSRALVLASKSLAAEQEPPAEYLEALKALIAALEAKMQPKGDEVEVTEFGAGTKVYKAGARNSKSDLARIQSIHDTATDMGASCSGAKSLDEVDSLVREHMLTPDEVRDIEAKSASVTDTAADEMSAAASDDDEEVELQRQRVRVWQHQPV